MCEKHRNMLPGRWWSLGLVLLAPATTGWSFLAVSCDFRGAKEKHAKKGPITHMSLCGGFLRLVCKCVGTSLAPMQKTYAVRSLNGPALPSWEEKQRTCHACPRSNAPTMATLLSDLKRSWASQKLDWFGDTDVDCQYRGGGRYVGGPATASTRH